MKDHMKSLSVNFKPVVTGNDDVIILSLYQHPKKFSIFITAFEKLPNFSSHKKWNRENLHYSVGHIVARVWEYRIASSMQIFHSQSMTINRQSLSSGAPIRGFVFSAFLPFLGFLYKLTNGFSKIPRFLEQILIERMDMKNSLDS